MYTDSQAALFRCSMKKSEIADKLDDLLDDLILGGPGRDDDIVELMALPPKEWRAAVAADRSLQEADAHVQTLTRMFIDPKTKEGKLWLARERQVRDERPDEYRSGRAAIERLREESYLVESTDVREYLQKLRTTEYLKVGMSVTDLEIACVDLRAAWVKLPPKHRTAVDPLDLLISKVPAAVTWSEQLTFSEYLDDEIATHAARHKGKALYTYDTLSKRIVTRMRPRSRSEPAGKAGNLLALRAGSTCYSCGERSPKCPGSKQCENVGRICGVKGCQCFFMPLDQCVFAKDELPPREKILNGGKKDPVGEHVYARFVKQFPKVHAKAKAEATKRGIVCVTRLRAEATEFVPSSEPSVVVPVADDGADCDMPQALSALCFAISLRTHTERDIVQAPPTLISFSKFLYAACIQRMARGMLARRALMRQSVAQRVLVPKSHDPRTCEWHAAVARELAMFGPPAEHRELLKQVMHELARECPSNCCGAVIHPCPRCGGVRCTACGQACNHPGGPNWPQNPCVCVAPAAEEQSTSLMMFPVGEGRTMAPPAFVAPELAMRNFTERMQKLLAPAATDDAEAEQAPSEDATSIRPSEGVVMMLSQHPPCVLAPRVLRLRMLLDTGADTQIVLQRQTSPEADVTIEQFAREVVEERTVIDGFASGATFSNRIRAFAGLVGTLDAFDLTCIAVPESGSPGLSINVIAHSTVADKTGARMVYEPEMVVDMYTRGSAEILRVGGTYWIDMIFGADRGEVEAELAALASVNIMAARVRAADPTHLWAARFGISSGDIPRLHKAIDGFPVVKASRESALLIDTDAAHRRAWQNRPSSASAVPGRLTANAKCGERWSADRWFATVPSMFGGHTGVLHLYDEVSLVGFAAPSLTETADDWIDLIQQLQRGEEALHHKVLQITFDAKGAEPKNDAFKRKVEEATGILVHLRPGDDHERVRVESTMDLYTRLTEESMYRAKAARPPAPDSLMVTCRIFQVQVANCRPAAGRAISRWQAHTGSAPSVRSMPIPLFWTQCSVHTLPTGRGPKGLVVTDGGLNGRSRTGRLVGISLLTNKYVLVADDTRERITRKAVDPLDEHVLIMAGVAAGAQIAEASTQIDTDDAPPLQLLPPAVATAPAPPRIVTRTVNVLPSAEVPAVGDTLLVMWKEPRGDQFREHAGVVRKVVENDDGSVVHTLEYMGWPQSKGRVLPHDLAADRASGKHHWRLAPAPKAVPPPQAKPPDRTRAERAAARTTACQPHEAQHAMTTSTASRPLTSPLPSSVDVWAQHRADRARAVAIDALDVLESAVDASDNPARTFNALVTLAYAELDELYEVADESQLLASQMRLRQDVMHGSLVRKNITAAILAASRGSNDTATYKAEDGSMVTMRVPRGNTKRALDAAPDSVEWYESDRVALWDSILSLPGNELVPEYLLIEWGFELLEFVTARKYKVSKETMYLQKRKSRMSLDEARQRRQGTALTIEMLDSLSTYTKPCGGIDFKCFVSTIDPKAGDTITTADYPDFYGVGTTNRAPRAVRLPETVECFDDNGHRMGLLLRTSLWGEGVAGFEAEITRDEDLRISGWLPLLGTPSSYYKGEDHRLISIIDDMCFRTRPGPQVAVDTVLAISERNVARGGKPLTYEVDAKEFGGIGIALSEDRVTVSLYLTVHVEQAARKWLPTFVDTGVLPETAAAGDELRRLLDGLRLMQGTGPLSTSQKDVQSITGVLRWLVQILIRIRRHVHRLSCVAARAPVPDARRAALGTLALAYLHRYDMLTYGGAFGPLAITGQLKGTMDSARGPAIMVLDGAMRLRKGAPRELDAVGDISWCIDVTKEDYPADLMSMSITHHGAEVFGELKKSPLLAPDTASAEGVASIYLSHKVMHCERSLSAYGHPQEQPVILASDNDPNLRVASGAPSATRLRHALHRWAILSQRVKQRVIRLAHLRDEFCMPDVFTKWTSEAKEAVMVDYLSGARARAAHPPVGFPRPTLADHEPYIVAAEAAVAKKASQVPTVPLAKPPDVDAMPAPGTAAHKAMLAAEPEKRRVAALERDERHSVRDSENPSHPSQHRKRAEQELKGILKVAETQDVKVVMIDKAPHVGKSRTVLDMDELARAPLARYPPPMRAWANEWGYAPTHSNDEESDDECSEA